jgi:VanZ family protein
LALIVVVAFPFADFVGHSHWSRVAWIPFASHSVNAFDVLANVAVAVPAGAALAARYQTSSITAGLVVGGVAVLCEWAQVYAHNRFATSTDVLCNIAGAMVGSAAIARRRVRS